MSGSRPSVVAAELELATTAATASEGLRYTVIDVGALPIMLGEAYELERLTDDGWERVRIGTNFRVWGRRLESGASFKQTARIPEFVHPGRYRCASIWPWIAIRIPDMSGWHTRRSSRLT